MDATMSGINDEMRVTADYAISIAKERYSLELDYSEESLGVLDNILEKIYWGFSGHTKDEGEGGLIYNSAIIWGSYLGEYMRLKWGGTWLMKGTDRRVSITTIEFSPISFVFQRITTHPEYSVKNFIQETKNVIYASVIHPPKPQPVPEVVTKPKPAEPVKPAKKPLVIDKRVIYITGGILGILIVVTACMAGYTLVSQGSLPAIGMITKITSTQTTAPSPTVQASATAEAPSVNTPTMTQLPTYTAIPTKTPRPSRTPLFTSTGSPSGTPTETSTSTPTRTETEWTPPTSTVTETPTPRSPTRTRTPTAVISPSRTPSPTASPRGATFTPTNTPRPSRTPTNTPAPSKTPTRTLEPSPTDTPVPTDTPIPPPTIEWCNVDPTTVPADGSSHALTFSVKFSVTGNSIDGMTFNPDLGGGGCTANADGDGLASCAGSSGLVGSGQSVNVTIHTSLGDCSVSYRGQ